MAQLIGGIGMSHAPSLASAWDNEKGDDPDWKPFFEGVVPAKDWLRDIDPDLMIIIYNDHMDRFFFDCYPTFAIGLGETFPVADEGWGKRPFPDFDGNPDFAAHALRSLVDDEFDITACHEMTIDHGILSPLPYISHDYWPAPILPLAVNVIHHPLPKVSRMHKLGKALRRAIESYPKDMRIVVMATGGMSHQLHGERFGFVNPDWDNRFMDLLEASPGELTGYTHEDLMRLGGAESVEMMMWLAMRGAMDDKVKRVHRTYHCPFITGFGLVAFENA